MWSEGGEGFRAWVLQISGLGIEVFKCRVCGCQVQGLRFGGLGSRFRVQGSEVQKLRGVGSVCRQVAHCHMSNIALYYGQGEAFRVKAAGFRV